MVLCHSLRFVASAVIAGWDQGKSHGSDVYVCVCEGHTQTQSLVSAKSLNMTIQRQQMSVGLLLHSFDAALASESEGGAGREGEKEQAEEGCIRHPRENILKRPFQLMPRRGAHYKTKARVRVRGKAERRERRHGQTQNKKNELSGDRIAMPVGSAISRRLV